jgi:hypothetical protein
MGIIKADHQAAARLSITAEQVAWHRNAGRHQCVDGRFYNDVCPVVDPTRTGPTRYRLHPQARTAQAGELIRVVAFAGALDGLDKVDTTYHLRVQEVTVRQHLSGWDQIEGVVEQPDRPRLHGKERSLLARAHHYDIVEGA